MCRPRALPAGNLDPVGLAGLRWTVAVSYGLRKAQNQEISQRRLPAPHTESEKFRQALDLQLG
jgi:hypothetical protein